MSDQSVPSRLGRKSTIPLTGMGSGIPANQRIHGVEHPEEAARQASGLGGPPKHSDEHLEKVADILHAWDSGIFKPEGGEKYSESQRRDVLLRLDAEKIDALYAEAVKLRERQIDEEVSFERDLPTFVGLLSPFYDALSDVVRRQQIEENLEPIDVTSMLFNNWVSQRIQISPQVSIGLRTLGVNQSRWIERIAMKERPDTDLQLDRHMGVLRLLAALTEINGDALRPAIETKSFKEFEATLNERVELYGNWPDVFIEDLVVQHIWFNTRVRKAFAGDLSVKVGNS